MDKNVRIAKELVKIAKSLVEASQMRVGFGRKHDFYYKIEINATDDEGMDKIVGYDIWFKGFVEKDADRISKIVKQYVKREKCSKAQSVTHAEGYTCFKYEMNIPFLSDESCKSLAEEIINDVNNALHLTYLLKKADISSSSKDSTLPLEWKKEKRAPMDVDIKLTDNTPRLDTKKFKEWIDKMNEDMK